jgi:hypothetical protein
MVGSFFSFRMFILCETLIFPFLPPFGPHFFSLAYWLLHSADLTSPQLTLVIDHFSAPAILLVDRNTFMLAIYWLHCPLYTYASTTCGILLGLLDA